MPRSLGDAAPAKQARCQALRHRRAAADPPSSTEMEYPMAISRRTFLTTSGVALAGASQVSSRIVAAGIPEAVTQMTPAMQPPLYPSSGPAYQPVVTLNGW